MSQLKPQLGGNVDPDTVVVVIGAGENETVFTVPRTLLCSSSPYFDRAFNGYFKEAVEGKLFMADEEPETFILYLAWLTGPELQEPRPMTAFDPQLGAQLLVSHIRLLEFCDKILSALYRRVGRRIVELTRSVPFMCNPVAMLPQEVLASLYRVTREGSWVRHWAVMNLVLYYRHSRPWMRFYKAYRQCILDIDGFLSDALAKKAELLWNEDSTERRRAGAGWRLLGWR